MIFRILLPAALAFIMFALGLTLTIGDFRRVFIRPKAMAAGLFGQMLLLPALAFLVALAWRLPPDMALGLLLLAACPGGASSALITHLAGGETALSISLTAITSVAAVFSVPLVLDVGLHAVNGTRLAGELPVGAMLRAVFLLTTVPVAAGVLLNSRAPRLTERLRQPAGRLATLFFVLIVVATFVDQYPVIAANLADIGPATLALNAAVMGAALGGARLIGLSRGEGLAVAAECGLQNAGLGIFIATSVLATPALAVPSVVYAAAMNLGAFVLIFLARRGHGQLATEA